MIRCHQFPAVLEMIVVAETYFFANQNILLEDAPGIFERARERNCHHSAGAICFSQFQLKIYRNQCARIDNVVLTVVLDCLIYLAYACAALVLILYLLILRTLWFEYIKQAKKLQTNSIFRRQSNSMKLSSTRSRGTDAQLQLLKQSVFVFVLYAVIHNNNRNNKNNNNKLRSQYSACLPCHSCNPMNSSGRLRSRTSKIFLTYRLLRLILSVFFQFLES